jgi:ABC-2 type transport system ATP-binding protein
MTPDARSPRVLLEGVTFRFGRMRALDGATLSLGGGTIGVLGPNGAGKSTLLRIIATRLDPYEGRLELLGRNPRLETDKRHIRRRLGYLPQAPGLLLRFTAFEFVDYVAIHKEFVARRARHDEVRRVLDLVGLTPTMHRRIRHLSGGTRQRVAIAQALLGRPELLVLDEPTTGLDPGQRMRFRTVLSETGAGCTVLLSTHHTEDVASLCDQVVVVISGKVRWIGSTRDFAASAAGHAWLSDEPDPRAAHWWRTGEGTVRNLGEPPREAEIVAPTVDDAYQLLMDRAVSDGSARGRAGTAQ